MIILSYLWVNLVYLVTVGGLRRDNSLDQSFYLSDNFISANPNSFFLQHPNNFSKSLTMSDETPNNVITVATPDDDPARHNITAVPCVGIARVLLNRGAEKIVLPCVLA